MGFVELGQKIRSILGRHVGGIFLGGSHVWKGKGRDFDILVAFESAPPKEKLAEFRNFAKSVEGRVEWGLHGPAQVFDEIASIFVTTKKDMEQACFPDAWTARLVLLGLRPHPENPEGWNDFAEKSQELAWRKFFRWIISRSNADSIQEIKNIAETDIIGSRNFNASRAWSLKKRKDNVFLRHVSAKIQSGLEALVREKDISIEGDNVRANFKDAAPLFRRNLSSSRKREDTFG